ncbi:putative Atrial natriuretic peptide receptor 1 [Hypsibius exemplaris]|uniref:Atrial natriuretic peptide receptor 1 n=1 Tax=Hypsibius exemplaris TaxID=2072580 RepID=A0A1W0WP24_HYPEX|nr:putative Atrial natriuretic peptide receptor 1 [Hypsibius exemplaris]
MFSTTLLVLFHLIILPVPSHSVNFTLITIAMSDGGRNGFFRTNPPVDILIDMFKASNPVALRNFTHVALRFQKNSLADSERLMQTEPPPEDCSTGAQHVTEMLASFYYDNQQLFSGQLTQQFPLLNIDSCPNIVMEVANFASATSTFLGLRSASLEFSDNVRFPTTLNLFVMPFQFFSYTLGYLARQFSWRELNVVYLKNDNKGFSFAHRTRLLEFLPYDYLQTGDFIAVPTVSSDSAPDVLVANLTDQRAWDLVVQKRVSLLLLPPDQLRLFMVPKTIRNFEVSFRLELRNESEVFIAYGTEGIPSRDNIFWNSDNEETDQVALKAFRALLIIKDGSELWAGAPNLSRTILAEYSKRYNWTMNIKDLAIVNTIRTIEWVEVFVETFLRLESRLPNLTVQQFVKDALNRTYDLPSRKFYLNEIGIMIVPVPILRLSPSGEFETILTFSVPTHTFQFPLASLDWFGNDTLPRDFPVCGINGEKCLSQEIKELLRILVPVMCFVLTIAVAIVIFVIRRRTLNEDLAYLLLQKDQLSLNEDPSHSHGSDVDAFLSQHNGLMGLTGKYGERNVFAKTLQLERTRNRLPQGKESALLQEALLMSRTRHANLVNFYGIILGTTTCQVIYERPVNGNILALLRAAPFLQTLSCVSLWWSTLLRVSISFTNPNCLTTAISAAKSVCNKDFRSDYQAADVLGFGKVLAGLLASDASAAVRPDRVEKLNNVTISSPHHMRDRCLNLDPQWRPTSHDLSMWTKDRKLFGRNIVDLLLDRLQTFANELEADVNAKTADLLEERRKLDELLLEMLPSLIITKLRNNEPIDAELFDSATVLFSDIPVFPRIVEQCGPLDVLQFLAQMHSAFDKVVRSFDVYKVETINDSYVVVSGLPVRNGEGHAAEICRLALKLRLSGNGVQVPGWGGCSPALRLGLNSGPVAAGVVGSRMPRFGDTMNTASRMESHGQANKIHVSPSSRHLAELHGQSQSPKDFEFISRGRIAIKGKGLIETFWLQSTTAHV